MARCSSSRLSCWWVLWSCIFSQLIQAGTGQHSILAEPAHQECNANGQPCRFSCLFAECRSGAAGGVRGGARSAPSPGGGWPSASRGLGGVGLDAAEIRFPHTAASLRQAADGGGRRHVVERCTALRLGSPRERARGEQRQVSSVKAQRPLLAFLPAHTRPPGSASHCHVAHAHACRCPWECAEQGDWSKYVQGFRSVSCSSAHFRLSTWSPACTSGYCPRR